MVDFRKLLWSFGVTFRFGQAMNAEPPGGEAFSQSPPDRRRVSVPGAPGIVEVVHAGKNESVFRTDPAHCGKTSNPCFETFRNPLDDCHKTIAPHDEDLMMRWIAIAALLAGCDAKRKEPIPPELPPRPFAAMETIPASSAPSTSASVAAAPAIVPGPAVVERFAVAGDRPASIVKSADGRPPRLVFLPGICSNGGAYLYGFAEAARAHGGAIAIDGDRPCGNLQDFSSITSDPDHEEPRIFAALSAAGVANPQTQDVILVGYSLGATLIENLVKTRPERYPRVILIGSPRDPRLDRLQGTRAVVTMSCSQDIPGRMKGASKRLIADGIASMYLEMPGCTHGNIAEGDRIFSEAFSWLDGFARSRP